MAAIHFVLVISLFAVAMLLLNGIDEFNELKPISPLQRSLGNAADIGFRVLTAPVLLARKCFESLFRNNAIEYSIVGLNSLLFGSVGAWLWSRVVSRRPGRHPLS
jgi:hypothetical protein